MSKVDKRPAHTLLWITAGLIPALLAVLLYSPTRDFGLVWDDHVLTIASVYSRHDLAAIFMSRANGFEYLPVRDLSLVLDYALHGEWWGGFHQTSFMLFALATALAAWFFLRLFLHDPDTAGGNRPYLLALACTLVFALHPLHVEPVAFIATRNAVLALCFCLAACLAIENYEHRNSRVYYWLGLIFLILALFSKATTVFLPLIFVLLAMHRHREYSLTTALGRYTPHLAVTALLFFVHLLIASQTALSKPLSLFGVAAKLHNVIFIPEFYLYKFLWPFDLITDYPYSEYFEHKVLLLVGSALFLYLVFNLYRAEAKRRSLVWFLLLSYLTALLPVMNLLPTTPPIADRYAQLPLLFLTPLLIVLMFRKLNLRFLVTICLLAGTGLAVLTARQVRVWESDFSLFSHTLASNPRSVPSMNNLASRLWIQGDKQQALDYFNRAAKITPKDMTLDFYRGRYAEETGDLTGAIQHYKAAAGKEGPYLYLAYLKLGLLHIDSGDYTSAKQALQKSIGLAGHSPQDEANKREARAAMENIDRILEQRRVQ